MASQTRMSAREEERRLNMRTLAIASAASATAAVITSQLWVAGTWIAAALTPVIVAVVSELLHRPAAVVAERVTSRGSGVLPQAAGAGAPPRRPEPELPSRAPADPGSGPAGAPPVRMYRTESGRGSGRGSRPSRRKVAIGVVAVTAALAFAIAAIAMTGTELVTGGSIGKGERDTTLFGGGSGGTADEQVPDGGRDNPAQGEDEPPQEEQPQSQPQPESRQPSEGGAPADPQPAPEAPEAPAPAQP